MSDKRFMEFIDNLNVTADNGFQVPAEQKENSSRYSQETRAHLRVTDTTSTYGLSAEPETRDWWDIRQRLSEFLDRLDKRKICRKALGKVSCPLPA